MTELLRGAPVVEAMGGELRARSAALSRAGRPPRLVTVRVGAREDDVSYERSAAKRAERSGVEVAHLVLDADCGQAELEQTLAEACADARTDGVLLFRPLPDTLDEHAAIRVLDAYEHKDVDTATTHSLLGVLAHTRAGFAPCTAEAVIALLDHYEVPITGARVTIVGRSLVIGRPVSMMLLDRDATVTICHTKTRDLAACCRQADILVVCAGRAGVVGADCVREGQVVVDVGINWDEAAGRIVGDVDFDAVEPIVAAITPVPGGIGTITASVLMRHVVESAERNGADHGQA